PEQPGERLNRFSKSHVVGEDAAELVCREIREKVETLDLIGAQIDVESRRDLGTDLELEVPRPFGDAFPSVRVENFAGGRFGQLERVEAVDLSGEVEGIEANFGNRNLLLFAEVHFQAQPAAPLHADELAAGLNEGANFLLSEVHAIDL